MTPAGSTGPLTGEVTRSARTTELTKVLARGEPVALVLVDLDHFKSVNDAFGRNAGDAALGEFNARIRQGVRGDDVIVRLGGDESLVLLPGLSRAAAEVVAERILRAVSSRPFSGPSPLVLTASAGIAVGPDDGTTAEVLLEVADVRLCAAKRRGRNTAIGVDVAPASVVSCDELSHWGGYDSAMETLRRFLDALPEKQRGLFLVSGKAGSGKSEFLTKAGEAARMRGFSVARSSGRVETRNRGWSAVRETLGSDKECTRDVPADLRGFVAALGAGTTVLIVDDLQYVDTDSQAALARLLTSDLGPLGIIYSTDRVDSSEIFPRETPLRETVELFPLSPADLGVWLRGLLQWEPPDCFVTWLYANTEGLPGLVRRGMRWLLDRGIMEWSKDMWIFHRDVTELSLREHLEPIRRAAPLDPPEQGEP